MSKKLVLVHSKTNKIVRKHDILQTFRGEYCTLEGWIEPKHDGSTGRIQVRMGDTLSMYYPSVCNLEWLRIG